jgi:hypothetical protein
MIHVFTLHNGLADWRWVDQTSRQVSQPILHAVPMARPRQKFWRLALHGAR